MPISTLFIDDCFSRTKNDPRWQKIELLKLKPDISVTELNAENLFTFKPSNKSGNDVFDLIFVDYKLYTGTSDTEGFSTGDQCESLVRSKCPDTPIYLLSVDVVADKEYERPEGFERQVGETFLSNPGNVYMEVEDHGRLREALGSGKFEALLSAMNYNDEFVVDDLLKSLPSRVRRCFSSSVTNNSNSAPIINGTKGARVEYYRWFIDLFYRNEGFLVDDHAAANILGMTRDHFKDNIEHMLVQARYNGIFSHSLKPRWWVSKLKDYVLNLDDGSAFQGRSFAEGCAKLLNVPPNKKAKCVKCEDLWPEALGFVQDDTDRSLHPVHIRCSTSDYEVDVGPYFTSPRLIVDE